MVHQCPSWSVPKVTTNAPNPQPPQIRLRVVFAEDPSVPPPLWGWCLLASHASWRTVLVVLSLLNNGFHFCRAWKVLTITAQVSAAAVHVCVSVCVCENIGCRFIYIYLFIYIFIFIYLFIIHYSLFIIYLSIFFIVIQCPENWRVCYESVGVSPQDFKHGKIMEALRPFLLAASLESCTKVTSACSSWSQLDCSKENSGNSWKFTQNDGYWIEFHGKLRGAGI